MWPNNVLVSPLLYGSNHLKVIVYTFQIYPEWSATSLVNTAPTRRLFPLVIAECQLSGYLVPLNKNAT